MCGSVLKKSNSDDKYDVLGLPKIVRSNITAHELFCVHIL